ncbi:MAG: hypothetical protein EXR31_10435 [Betaproteobacteria bacterium]|nr:hypothetical protein [Betaproteobacteria bacterium]
MPSWKRYMPRNEAERLAYNAFCERYAFWKYRGQELVGPKELREYALARLRTCPFPWVKSMAQAERIAAVDTLLSSDTFLRPHYGNLLTRIVEAIEEKVADEAWAAGRR